MPKGLHIVHKNGFFRDLVTPDALVNLLVGYDSKSITCGSLPQGSFTASLLNCWDFPPQSDGTPALVGISTHGAKTTNALDKLVAIQTTTTTPANFTVSSFTAIGAEPGVNGEADRPFQHYTRYSTTAGVSRTAWNGTFSTTGSQTGVVFQATLGGAPVQLSCVAAPNAYQASARGDDPFSGRSVTCRFIGHRPGTNGPNDMCIQGYRILDGVNTMPLNSFALVPSPATVDFSGTAGPFKVDASCGSGFGRPGMVFANPASGITTNATNLYSTGLVFFRDTGTLGVRRSAGVTVGVMAIGGGNGAQFASGLGCTDVGTDPSPYYSAANAQQYLKDFIDMPTHVLIYCGHNNQAAEHADFTTYLGGGAFAHTWRNNLISMVNQMKLLCANEGKPVPKFLFVFREWNDHTKGVNDDDAGWDACVRDELIQVCKTTGSEMIDLWGETWDGITTDYNTGLTFEEKCAKMPYTQKAHARAKVGTSAGPIQGTDSDFLHNSVTGQNMLVRMVWEIGLKKIGYEPTQSVRGARNPIKVNPRPIPSRLR